MKKVFFLLFLLPLFAVAQKVITHTVAPKESLTSIGRLYNINGRELANYNKIDYDKGLALGQVLKIPVQNAPAKVAAVTPSVKTAPVVQPVPPAATVSSNNKSGKPIYHTVAKQETLYRISTMYNKVPIADIKKWNNLTSDALSEGTKLIIGYSGEKNVTETKTAVVKEPVAEKPKKEDSPRIKTAGEEEIDVKAKEEVKEMQRPKLPVVTPPVSNARAKDFNGGYFKNIFDNETSGKQLVNESGTGGVFKSTSGWEDGKYYCLHNTATAGTIVKVTNKATGKTVYAKVLDMIPDIKQNTGLVIRISNAAADALGATADSKLDCTINYSK
jgi:LysM repeat protein